MSNNCIEVFVNYSKYSIQMPPDIVNFKSKEKENSAESLLFKVLLKILLVVFQWLCFSLSRFLPTSNVWCCVNKTAGPVPTHCQSKQFHIGQNWKYHYRKAFSIII